MNEPTMETLTRRVDRIERENQRLKQAGIVVLAVIAAMVMMGQATQGKVAKLVEAEKFIVKDAKGKPRVVLGAESSLDNYSTSQQYLPESKSYGFHLYGTDGRYRAGISEQEEGGAFAVLRDNQTVSGITISAGGASATLSMNGTQETYEQSEREAKRLETLSTEELIKATEKHLASFRPDVFLKASSREGSSLEIAASGVTRATLGRTNLETIRTGVVEQRPESSLVLFDKDKKVIWRAP